MNKQQLILDGKLYKRLQSSVKRKLGEDAEGLTIPQIRSYCLGNIEAINQNDYQWLVENLFQAVLTGTLETQVNEEVGLVPVENDSSFVPIKVPGKVPIKDEESGLSVIKPESQSNQLATKEEPQSLTVQIQESISLETSTQALTEELINYEVEETISSVQDLRDKLAAIRSFKEEAVTGVLNEHLSIKTQTLSKVRSMLSQTSDSKEVRNSTHTEVFLGKLKQAQEKLKS